MERSREHLGRRLLFGVLAGALSMIAVVPPSLAQSPTKPPSMLDQAATPPAIQLIDGKLTITATNSSLRAILDDLQTRTGTKIEGLNRDERIFGVYGPGDPQEVLASLLDDSGYNVIISGVKTDGAPREIVLSTRVATAATGPAQTPRTQAADEDDEGDEASPSQQPALFGASPAAATANTQQPAANAQQQVRTPQQMLEELQRMRQNGGAAQGTGAASTSAAPQQ